MSTKTVLVKKSLIQTAATWPQDDNGWTTEYTWTAKNATQTITGTGRASIVATYGQRLDLFTGPTFTALGPSPKGKWCRILTEDAAGTIPIRGLDPQTPNRPTKFKAVWHGRIKSRELQPDHAKRPTVRTGIEALWIADAFRFDRLHTHEVASNNSVCFTYQTPVFNVLPGGDMSSALYAVDGTQTPIFDRSLGSGDPEEEVIYRKWTYGAALKYLCASARANIPGGIGCSGPKLTLGTYPAALDLAELPNRAGKGRSTLDIIASFINSKMGLEAVLRVVGKDIFLDVIVVAPEDFVLGRDLNADPEQEGVTLTSPFSTGKTLDLFDNRLIKDVIVTETEDGADYIQVIGGDAAYGLSLSTAYVSGQGEGLIPHTWKKTDTPTEEGTQWRLWRIGAEWNGIQRDTPDRGLPSKITHTPTGSDGLRLYNATDPHPSNDSLNFLRELPWTEIRSDAEKLLTVRPTPRLFALKNNRGEDLTGEIPIIPLGGGLVRLGTTLAHAVRLKELDTAGYEIVLTIAVIDWHPMLATWFKTTGRTSDLIKTLVVEHQGEITTALKGTVSRLKDDGSIEKIANDINVHEDQQALLDLRDALAAKHKDDSVTLTWRDLHSPAPIHNLGDAFKEVTTGLPPTKITIPTKSIVTSISMNFEEHNYGCRYDCLRLTRG
jgi:hypothetical protein